MYDFRDTWEIDTISSKRHGCLILERPWWATAGEDYLFVPFAVSTVIIGVLGTALPGSAQLGFSGFAALGILALLAGFRGVRANYALTRLAVPGSLDSNRVRCRDAVAALGWSIVRDNRDFLIATTPPSLFTWGRVVVIFYEKDAILVSSNSREGPGPIPRSPYAFGTRKASLRLLESQLARAAA
jgi:hypothetical protein